MARFLLLTLILLSAINSFAQERFESVKNLRPLHSNRSEVERVAKSAGMFGIYFRYQTDAGLIDVYYAKEKCVGHGWNVPRDRVIEFNYYPKNAAFLKDVIDQGIKVIQTVDDTGTSIFTDLINGKEYVVRRGESKIDYIRFTPTAASAKLRCKGFPPYDPAADNYSPYQKGVVENPQTWDPGSLIATLVQVRDDPSRKGYVFVYCKRGTDSGCRKAKSKIDRAVGLVMKAHASRIVVSLGGYREHVEVESFLLPHDYPPARARPTFAEQP